MKTCISCKKNKDDKEFDTYTHKLCRETKHRKRIICSSCRSDNNGYGVSRDLADNNIKLKNKTFKNPIRDGWKKGGFRSMYQTSDCAIDEASLDYSEFEDIPDITDINKETK